MSFFQGLHPRVAAEGFDLAKAKALEVVCVCFFLHLSQYVCGCFFFCICLSMFVGVFSNLSSPLSFFSQSSSTSIRPPPPPSQVLEELKVSQEINRGVLINVSRTSLHTKVHSHLADLLTEVTYIFICFHIHPHMRTLTPTHAYTHTHAHTQHVVDAVLAIQQKDRPIDLHMVEIMQMQHKTDMDTK